ncbi:MAG: hypothetical protein H7177_00465 [Rhizobacter sp.]|nr:hypothetical protein [Bacteriovorax sp.]
MISFFKGILIRHFHNVDCIWKLDDVTVKVAETYEELKAASELLHDSYVGKKLMEAHPSGMRINIHSLLPHCTVIVAVDKLKRVIGTVSLIRDTQLGIPADHAFKIELNNIRNQMHRQLVEVSALAIHPMYRHESHGLQFLLNRYLYTYCKNILNINTLVIVIHPNAEYFYKALLLFKPMGRVVSYSFVKGALARLMYLDFSGEFEKKIWRRYLWRKNSLVDYFLHQNDERLIYKKLSSNSNDSVGTLDKNISMKLIRASGFNINILNQWELSSLITGLNLDISDLEKFNLQDFNVISSYRFYKKIFAQIRINNHSLMITVFNLSKTGAFLEMSLEYYNESVDRGYISFNLNGVEFSTEFKICWINNGRSNKLPFGIGIQFINGQLDLFDAA